ncbi:MAG TPA: hypothetical protein ACQGQX_07080 [Xylella taiwanensis]
MLLTNRRDVVGIMLFGYPVLKKTPQWKKSDAAELSLIIVMFGTINGGRCRQRTHGDNVCC